MSTSDRDRKFPVVEIFGPVLEGEGPLAGQPTTFIRFGYCDSRCTWCDSLHAVLPERVREGARWLTAEQIYEEVRTLAGPYPWITFSGGNPVTHYLPYLVELFQEHDYRVKVETQGTYWRDWILQTDMVILSPKPPSAGQYRAANAMSEDDFCQALKGEVDHAVKIVVFDEVDLEYARAFAQRNALTRLWISVGTDASDTRDALGERYAKIGQMVLDRWKDDRVVPHLTVLPQLHVVAHLHRQGV